MGRHRNKPTDLQRFVMRAAADVDPSKRVVGAQYVHAANILAERGYITVRPCGDKLQVELSDLAMRNYGLRSGTATWQRFPPLRA
jgi:hypothetical protein